MTKEIGVGLRQEIERKIASQVINDLHNAGFSISVNNDGDEDEVVCSLDHNEVLGALMASDEDYLYAIKPGEVLHSGWVRLVYGNDGSDVISDYTTNLDSVLAKSIELSDNEDKRLFG